MPETIKVEAVTFDFAPSNTISFFVPGRAAPGGSKRFVGFSKKTGRAVLIDDAGQRNKNWRTAVAYAGYKAAPAELLRGALAVEFAFIVARPKSHFHTSKKRAGELKANAPAHPIGKPDVLKLSRSTEDALTNVIWADDAQTVSLKATKTYGEKPGCKITITPI